MNFFAIGLNATCEDYWLTNKQTHLDKYAMPLPKETFGQGKVFSTLDLYFNYHSLPLREGDKVKTSFWGIDVHGKFCLYQWQFLPFGLKITFAKFQNVMHKML
jgi:hypothetical protein